MLKTRGNLSSSRKPGIDPRLAHELSKIIRSVPNITAGDQFPGRGAQFGDLHYYTGENTTSYKTKNWYIKADEVGEVWQSMNATSLVPENIQAGTIGSGVKIVDYLALVGGDMLGVINFHEDQTFKPEMLQSGIIPASVTIAGYVPAVGGTYLGNIDMTDHVISSISKLYGVNNLLYIDMSTAGLLSLVSDSTISLSALNLLFAGDMSFDGDVAISGDLQVNGLNIGISSDTDLIALALNLLTINGALTVTGNLLVDGTYIGITTDTDLIEMAANLLTVHGDIAIGANHYYFNGTDTSFYESGDDIHVDTPANKTIVLDEVVYQDLWTAVDPSRVVGTTNANFIGNLRELVFSNGDYADFPSSELQHDYKEGTDIGAHLHIATRGTNASAYNVRYTLEYTWADVNGVFPAPTTLDVETVIPGGTAEFTHLFIALGSISGAGKHIGSQFKYQLKRIASASDDAPAANNPYVLQVGLHYQVDTLGSRQVASK